MKFEENRNKSSVFRISDFTFIKLIHDFEVKRLYVNTKPSLLPVTSKYLANMFLIQTIKFHIKT